MNDDGTPDADDKAEMSRQDWLDERAERARKEAGDADDLAERAELAAENQRLRDELRETSARLSAAVRAAGGELTFRPHVFDSARMVFFDSGQVTLRTAMFPCPKCGSPVTDFERLTCKRCNGALIYNEEYRKIAALWGAAWTKNEEPKP